MKANESFTKINIMAIFIVHFLGIIGEYSKITLSQPLLESSLYGKTNLEATDILSKGV
jgi:hypothetical protein